MRLLRTTLLLPVLVLALVAGGCGSSEDEVPEVPGAPAELTVPHQKGAADVSEDASATPTPSASADAEATATPTADSGTTGSTGSTGSTGTTGSGTNTAATPAPATQQDSPTNDTAPPEGSAPEQFEQFCQENAGAC